MVNKINNYVIFGNPIEHSKSPYVHWLFSKQLNINYQYDKVLVSTKNFVKILNSFFQNGGRGANITLPFKKEAFKLANQYTVRARLAGVINTLKLLNNGQLLGDNTDGIGLIKDLKRLNFINSHSNILIIGSGGAAQGVLFPLLSLGCLVTITNRTFLKAQQLSILFSNFGKIRAIEMYNLTKTKHKFDLIINATSSGIINKTPSIPSSLITKYTYCYDMFYQKHKTPFLNWCEYHGAKYTSDGLGMLVEQAAYTTLLWHGILPNTEPIINDIRDKL